MKKILLIPLMALIVLLSYADSIPGDVNGDGKVTMADANAIWNHCMGLLKETIDLSAADVNKDGSITKEDAMEAMNIFLTDKEFEEMSGDAMYIKLTTGETAVISVATITDRSMNAARDSFIVTTTEGRVAFAQAEIKERSYGAMPTRLTVSYGESTEVTNPYYATGVKTTINGGDVTLQNTNTSAEYTFELSGTTADGSLLYQGSYKATFILNGVSITSSKGAAIDIECGKRIAMELKKGTENTLTDCTDGQQKAALYCKGHLEIDKAGTLNVRGNTKHAIAAKEYIQFKNSSGTINILGAKGDAIHCQQYFLANGYTFNIDNVEGDGIQAELCGDADYAEAYPDGSIIIQGGTYNINISSDGCKALKADGDITINAEKSTPVMTLTLSGSYVIENGDPSYTSGIKADGNITITDGTIKIENNGVMSKSIKSKATVRIDGGKLTLSPSGGMQVINNDASYSTAIKAVDAIINGGDITITSTGTAGRGISATNVTTNGGVLTITNSGNGQSGTNDSYTAKGIKADNKIALNDGTITIRMSGTGGKGIVSSGTYTQGQTGGTGPALTVSTTGSSFGSSSSGQQGGWGGMQQSSGSSAKAIKAQGAITVYGGTTVVTTATNGAEGLESKTSINIAGGSHYLKCYDDCINSAGQINFSGGTTVCYATNNDAVDSNYGRSGAITISGGNVFAYTSAGSPEEGLDCDNNSYITITGGIAISAGGSQGGGGSSSQSVGSASQGYYLGNSPSSYGTSYYYTLCNTSGEAICTFKFEGNVSNSLSLLTAPNLGKGSVTVKYGTSAPTAAAASVANASGNDVFFITPTVTTTGTTTTVTAK